MDFGRRCIPYLLIVVLALYLPLIWLSDFELVSWHISFVFPLVLSVLTLHFAWQHGFEWRYPTVISVILLPMLLWIGTQRWLVPVVYVGLATAVMLVTAGSRRWFKQIRTYVR